MNLTPQFASLMKIAVAKLAKDIEVDVCSFYFYHKDPGEVELIATHGLSQTCLGKRFSIENGLTGQVVKTQFSVFRMHPMRDPEYYHLPDSDEEQYETYQGIPVKIGGEMVGVIVAQTIAPKYFKSEQLLKMKKTGEEICQKHLLQPAAQ